MTNAQFLVVEMAEAMETAEVVEMAEAITLTFVSEISKVCYFYTFERGKF